MSTIEQEAGSKKLSTGGIVAIVLAVILVVAGIVAGVMVNKIMGQLQDGATQLYEGAQKLSDGSVTLDDGSQQLAEGSTALLEGITAYTDGVGQLYAAVPTLSDGVQQLADGSKKLDSYKGAMNGIAGKIADGLYGVRGTVNGNADYQTLVAGANQIADNTKVGGAYQQGVKGMYDMITGVNSTCALVTNIPNAQVPTYASGFETYAADDFTALATKQKKDISETTGYQTIDGAYGSGAALLYSGFIAGFQDSATTVFNGVFAGDPANISNATAAIKTNVYNATNATGYLVGAKVISSSINKELDDTIVYQDATGKNYTGVQFADYMLNVATPTLADGASQVAGGIPQVIDTVCDGLESTAASFVNTKDSSSLKSQLATYTDGVSQLAAGIKTLNAGVPTLAEGVGTLNDNSSALVDGATQINDGLGTVSENTPTLSDGMKTLLDGIGTLLTSVGGTI